MIRFRHILVIVDPTKRGRQAAVDKAAHLARCSNASVELLICEIASALDDQLPMSARRPHPDNTELLDMLDELAGPLRAQAIQVSLRIIYGKSLPDTLLDYLHGSCADLVVKDTHPHPFARRTFARNADWHLVRGCPKPLLLTKRKSWHRPPRVITAVDLAQGEECAAAANHHVLNWAAALSGYLKSDLHIMHSYIPTAFAALVRAGRQGMSRDYTEALQAENSYRSCEIADWGNAYGVPRQHLHLEMGTAHDCLRHLVAQFDSDLVVIGSPSHKWRRMFIGSTAASILESLECDILIVGTSEFADTVPARFEQGLRLP